MNSTNFYIDLHGCAKNQTDAEIIVSFLEKAGFSYVQNPENAAFILINSCGFIQSAKKESIDAIYDLRAAYPKAKIILTGCLAERYSQALYEQMPELDGVFGNGNLAEIAGFMKKYSQDSQKMLDSQGALDSLDSQGAQNQSRFAQTFPQQGICAAERKVLFNFPGSAYVKITEGCSNHCSFCAIPLIRGELRSRAVDAIVEEIKALITAGVYEINLIGQDIAAYGTGLEEEDKKLRSAAEKAGLSPIAYLISKIAEIKGDFIVRPLYIHPDHFKQDILSEMKKNFRFVPYFDIPFQSGDDTIIRKMNRTGSAAKYEELIKQIRDFYPQAVLRTTFLTGFPGETDQAAENTVKFLKNIAPDWSGCFPYSKEEDTPAYSMKPDVPARVAKKRADGIEKVQSEITSQKLTKYVGQTLLVLIEEIIEMEPVKTSVKNAADEADNSDERGRATEECDEGLAIGRAWFQAPEVDGCVVVRYERTFGDESAYIKPGNLVEVKVLAVTGVDLDARFLSLKKAAKSSLNYII